MGCSRSTVDLVQPQAVKIDVPISTNACGGTAALSALPEDACGTCGIYRCGTTNSLRCEDPGANACGRCGKVPEEECNGRDDNCDGVIDEGCVRKLASLPTWDSQPRVSGSHVVFRAGGAYTNAADIVLVTLPSFDFEILSPHATPIDDPGDPSQENAPDIDGDLVAWTTRQVDPFGESGRLMGYDISTKVTFEISSMNTLAPAVNKGRVLFQVSPTRYANDEVWLWESASGKTRKLTTNNSDDQAPDLSGEWAVYTRGTGSNPYFNRQIVAHNIATDETIVTSTGLPGWNALPAISGTRIVWRNEDGNQAPSYSGEIWMYDLLTKVRTKLASGTVTMPRISGTLVCWTQSNDYGITLLDTATSKSRAITTVGSGCDIDARKVVWGGNHDVYVRDLLTGEP